VALSYPAVFVAGGVSLTAAAVLWATGERRGWLPWAAYNALLLGTFGLVFLTAARGQSEAELGFMDSYWREAFPPVAAPLELPGWLLATHTGDLLAYPVGGGHGASTLTFLCFAVGVVALVRRRRWLLLLLLLSPFALQLTAAALQRYPYGGHMKFAQPLAPLICVLTGLGGVAWVGACPPKGRLARVLLGAALLFPLLVGVGCIVRDLAHPYKTLSDMRARSFASWFWFCAESEGEAVCLKSDWGLDFAPQEYQELSWAAMYLCNQKIYSPRHAAGEPPRLDRVAADRPLRCLFYRDPDFPCDEAALDRWLAETRGRYRLVGREVYAFPRYDKREQRLLKVDHLEIFTFVPKDAPAWDRAEPGRGGVEARPLALLGRRPW
jgi:hypothetical protein